jgi:hypothetical protein
MTMLDAQDERDRPAPDPADLEPAGPARPAVRAGVKRARTALAVAIVLLAGLATYSLLRIAGEQHYQSCVSAAEARFGTTGPYLSALGRANAVDRCSRSIF